MLPIIEQLVAELAVPVSIDTRKPEVMRAAVAAGAALINDTNALRASGALEVAAASGVPVCLMHMQGEPRTMQRDPRYGDVVDEVAAFLAERVRAAEQAGVAPDAILLEPEAGIEQARWPVAQADDR